MKNPNVAILLWLFLLVFTSCQAQERALSFESIAQRDIINYQEENPALIVITNADEIDTLVPNILAEDLALANQLGQLDYDRMFAILVLQGLKGSTGYAATVQQITRQGSQIKVKTEFIEPSPDAYRNWAFTSPYHLVAVSKAGKWGQQIKFVLVANDEPVAETSYFIP